MLTGQSGKIIYIQILTDLIAVSAAWFLSYFIRFYLLPGSDSYPLYQFTRVVPVMLIAFLLTFTRNNLYHSYRFFSWYKEVFLVAKSAIQGFGLFFVLVHLLDKQRMSRLTFILFMVLVIGSTVIMRLIVRRQLVKLRKNGRNIRNIVLVGDNNQVVEYARTIAVMPQSGIRISAWVDSNGSAEQLGIPEISMDELLTWGNKLHMVAVGYHSRETHKIAPAIRRLNQTYIRTMMIPDIEYAYLGFAMQEFEGIPLIEVNQPRLSMINALLKRTMDIIGATIGLIILSPVFILIGLAVKLTSRGPIFYGQERVSLDGHTFRMWKFRSMRIDAEDTSGAKWATKDDGRKTVIGGFLRSTSIDEIPQFWNVLVGDMSLVGPRPERPVFIEKFKEEIPNYMLRHRMKAGITGWAQVNGWRGNTSIEKRIEFDIYYIRHWSLWFDIRILLLTFVKGFVNPNAY